MGIGGEGVLNEEEGYKPAFKIEIQVYLRRMRFHASVLLIFPIGALVSRHPSIPGPRGCKPIVLIHMESIGLRTRHGGATPASSEAVVGGTFIYCSVLYCTVLEILYCISDSRYNRMVVRGNGWMSVLCWYDYKNENQKAGDGRTV